MSNIFTSFLRVAISILFPNYCAMCGHRLAEGETTICTACSLRLPYTGFRARRDNPLEVLLHGRFPFERATSFMYYQPATDSRRIVFNMKYYGRPQVGREMGRRMSRDLDGTGFFDGVDVLLPVPLAKGRRRKRGYNQSQWLARGISEATGIGIETAALARIVDNPTQTHMTAAERQANVAGVFRAVRPERLVGRHVLLVDDVITTGSTITACADALRGIAGVRISVISLAVTMRLHRL